MKSKGGLQVWAEGKQAVGEMAEQGGVRSSGHSSEDFNGMKCLKPHYDSVELAIMILI